MTKRSKMIGDNGEVSSLGEEFFASAKRGRPKMLPSERKVRMNVMIDAELVEQLSVVGNKSAFVNEAVRKALKG